MEENKEENFIMSNKRKVVFNHTSIKEEGRSQNYTEENDQEMNLKTEENDQSSSNELSISPKKALLNTLLTLVALYICVKIFDFQVDSIITYVCIGVAGLYILSLIGRLLTFQEKEGKSVSSVIMIIIDSILLLWLGYCFFGDLYDWIFNS